MKVLLLIGTGSFIGGVGRYLVSLVIQQRTASAFPYGTLAVNLAGCFLIGLLFGMIERGHIPGDWRFFLATGILGGFTTFSAFSHESIGLMQNGQYSMAAVYIASSVVAGLFATFIGIFIMKTA